MIPKELLKKIRKLEIRTKGLVSNLFGGEYHSAFKGRGVEFAEVRPYQYGDDIRTIDWNVSARSGDETFVKVFQEEREQTLMLAVDISASGDFGTQTMLKREMAAEICAVLAFSAIQNNDKVGLLLFTDQVELFVPPNKGRRHVLRIIRDMYAYEPKSKKTNLTVACDHILHVMRRRAIVLFISDFYDTNFEKRLQAVANRNDTIAIRLTDPRERQLPNVGILTLVDAETGQTKVIDTRRRRVQRAFAHFAETRQDQLDALLKKIQLDVIEISTEEGYLDPLVRFFRQRHKRR
jgi:uncharacterized protein (DUF58 family)